MKKVINLFFSIFLFLIFSKNIYALKGTVNVNDSLTLRSAPNVSGTYLTSFYNGTSLDILDINASKADSVCQRGWYKVSYGVYTGYSCGDYIDIINESNSNANGTRDDSFNIDNYKTKLVKDGSIMCYEDTGSLTLRSNANGARTSNKVNCGDEVNILDTVETKNSSCPYWYKISAPSGTGFVCGYFVNTTKLSKTAKNYYDSILNNDSVNTYKEKLRQAGFPESYYSYLLEMHARHPNWNFVAEKINLSFLEVVDGENGNGASLLEGASFDKGYYSTNNNSFDIINNKFKGYESEPGYYNASREAIAYYMDPRNYLNEKYIFAFETLGFSENQNENVVSNLINGMNFFKDIYNNKFEDGTGNVNTDIVSASRNVGISAVHVASRIRQEMGTSLTTDDSRLGGIFTYNGNTYRGFYNFFNIKCYNCNYLYAGYAFEHSWNTPYKGIYGGASFMYNGYISVNQDTIYYEKFDVSTTNGNYTHQYMQNLSAPIAEGGSTYTSYSEKLANYLDTAITFVIPVYNNMPERAVSAPKLGSPNNYLKNIKINGKIIPNYNYDTYSYNIYTDEKNINIEAQSIDSAAKISGIGSYTIDEDTTKTILITAENGKTRSYILHFILNNVKEEEKMEEEINNNITEGVKEEIENKQEEIKPQPKPEEDIKTILELMNNSGFKYNNNNLFGINIGTNVSTIIGNITTYYNKANVTITDSKGNSKNNDIFKTGDLVYVSNGKDTIKYQAVIYGDVNGDGRITSVDYMTIKNYIMASKEITGVYLSAADANHDGKISAIDYMAIKNYIMGKSKIEQG